jgi:hypothetical protein
LNDTLAMLRILDVISVDNWRRFLDTVCKEGVDQVTAALVAEAAAPALPHQVSVVADGVPAMADIEANPWLPVAEEPSVEASSLLAVRPETGRIDLTYKPFSTWTISSKVAGGKEQWFVDFGGASPLYIGYRFTFQDTYIGLARTGSAAGTQVPYDHEAYRSLAGDWASFIHPTARCESEGQFLVVNSWDAAAMTLGFFQMAAHTGEHLADLIIDLIDALPDEAERFFPELKLGKQIGGVDPLQLFAVNGTDRLDLGLKVAPSDGLHSASYYRGRFMGFFNPHRGRLDPEEVAAAARWIAWAGSHGW